MMKKKKTYLVSVPPEESLARLTADSVEVIAQRLVPTYQAQLVFLCDTATDTATDTITATR